MPSPYGKKRLDDNTHSYSWMYVCQKKSRGRRICFDSTTNPGLDGWLSKDSFSENDCREWLSDFLDPSFPLHKESAENFSPTTKTIFLVLKRTKKTVSAKLLNFTPPPGFEVRDWCWGGGWLAAKEKVTLETAAAETAAAASSKSWIGFSRDKKVGNHFPIETAGASVGEN